MYAHLGFELEPRLLSVTAGLALAAAVFLIQFKLVPHDSELYVLCMGTSILFCLPCIVFYQLGGGSVYPALYSLLLLLCLAIPRSRIPCFRFGKVPCRHKWVMLLAATGLMLIPFVATYGIRLDLSVFSLGSHSYDVRAAAKAQGNLLTSYLIGPLSHVLLPLMIVYGCLDRKRWWVAAVAVACLLYLFLITPQKSILFTIGVALLFTLFRQNRPKAGLLVVLVLGCCLATVALNLATGHLMAESYLVRRTFFIPAQIASNHFHFYDGHPLRLSHSILSRWFDYPYILDPAHQMGFWMYNRTITSCNTGIIGDGFMNFNHWGALLWTILGAVALRFYTAQRCDPHYFGLVFLLLFTFLNCALFTTMLTHGGWMLILAALFLIPSKSDVAD